MKNTFKTGDHVVYPGHGVGEVTGMETREVMGSNTEFYIVRILDSGMRVMVPVKAVESIGVRPVLSKGDALKVLETLLMSDVKVERDAFNRRYREYMEKLKTGDPFAIAEVLRDLSKLKFEKDLSYGERNMIQTARALLTTELSLVLDKATVVQAMGAL